MLSILRYFSVIEKIGPRVLSKHLRTFTDYLVNEFANPPSSGNQYVNRCVQSLNDLIWRYNVVSIDRLILVLVRRQYSFSCITNSSNAHIRCENTLPTVYVVYVTYSYTMLNLG